MSANKLLKVDLKLLILYFFLCVAGIAYAHIVYSRFYSADFWLYVVFNILFATISTLVFYLSVKFPPKAFSIDPINKLSLSEIFENSSELMIIVNKELKIESFNKKFADYVRKNFKIEVFVGSKYADFLMLDNSEYFLERIQNALAGKKVQFETKLIYLNTTIYGEIEYNPIFEKDSSIKRIIVCFKDITERKKLELAFEYNKLKLETIFNRTDVAIFMVDPYNNTILDCNQTTVDLFEANDKSEIIDKNGLDFHLKPWTEQETKKIWKLFSENINTKIDIEYLTFKGRIFVGQLSTKNIQIADESYNIVWVADITDKKITEEKIINSEKNLKSILDTTLETSVLLNNNMEVVFANLQMVNLQYKSYGVSINVGDSFLNFVPIPERENFILFFNNVLKGADFRKKICVLDATNRKHWLDVMISPVSYSEGAVDLILLSFNDITHLKLDEEKLRASESKFRELADTSHVMMWIADETGSITFYNKAWNDFRGRSLEQEIRNGWTEGIHPEDLQWFLHDTYLKSFENQSGYTCEFRLLNHAGEYRWILETGAPKFNEYSGFEGMIGTSIDITDRKNAELKLKEEQSFIRKIAELSPDIIYIYDLQKDFYIYMNQESIANKSISNKNIIGESQKIFSKYILTEDLEKFYYSPQYLKILQTKKIIENEFRVQTVSDGWKWVQTRETIFAVDAAGNPTQILGNARDISNKKSVEKQLFDEQKLKERITNLSPDIIYLKDINEDKIIYQNRSILYNLGYMPSEILSADTKVVWNLMHPDDRTKKIFHSYDHLTDNDNIKNEFRLKAKDGSYHWFSSRDSIFDRDKLGNITQILSNTSDITDRKLFEQKLLDAQKFSQQITETSPHLIFIFDVEKLQFLYINNKIFNDLGYLPEEDFVIGPNMYKQLTHPDDLAIVKTNLENFLLLDDQEEIECETRVLHQNGSFVWLNIRVIVFKRNSLGVPIHMLGNSTNVTERKLMEQNLITKNQELKVANEELDSFVYRASHDLRSPLASVLGLINVLKHDMREEHHLKYVDLMQRSVEKLMNVTGDLINHTKNIRLEINSDIIDIKGLVLEMIQELSYMDNANQIAFNVNVEGTYELISDQIRLNLLFNNLISNAIKYHLIARGNPYINVNIIIEETKFRIIIADNGCGIEDIYQDKIFNMFYRASKNSTGSGLGLYIVKGIIEKLKGTFTLNSVYGEGSTFTIDLPNLKL